VRAHIQLTNKLQ